MEIVKNNIVSIILGVIALVALTTPLWLLPGKKEQLEKYAADSKRQYASINQLLNKERMKPGVSIEGQPEPLEQFPNQATIEEGQKLQKSVATTASDMLRTAVEINRSNMTLPGLNDVVLVEDALPRPRNQADFRFRDTYNNAVNDGMLTRFLQGGTPPTKEEIDAEIIRLRDRIMRELRTFPGGGDNRQELEERIKQEALLVAPRMLGERANSLRMYVDPNAFTWHAAVLRAATEGRQPNPVEIWQAQLGLWIQTSFAKAINAANANARNVRDAVVKRLLRIEFPDNPYVLAAQSAASSDPWAGEGAAVPVPASEGDPAAPLPRDYAKSITGRISNPLFDVVHFRAVMHVDHARLPLLLRELSANRLLYVRAMYVESVDPFGQELQGYVYGKNPVVQVTLDMEMLFMRAWTRDLMPDPVRAALGIPPQNPNAAMGSSGFPGGGF